MTNKDRFIKGMWVLALFAIAFLIIFSLFN